MFSHAHDMFIMMFKLNNKGALEVKDMSLKYNNDVKPLYNFTQVLKKTFIIDNMQKKIRLTLI